MVKDATFSVLFNEKNNALGKIFWTAPQPGKRWSGIHRFIGLDKEELKDELRFFCVYCCRIKLLQAVQVTAVHRPLSSRKLAGVNCYKSSTMKSAIRFLAMSLLFWSFLTSDLLAQWTTYAPMPGTRWAHMTAAAGGKLYVAGGSTAPTWEYDPIGNTWTVRASIPTLRSYPGIASWNGMVYVLGGSVGAAWSNVNERFDPVTNTWTTMAPMPQVRTTTAAAAVNGKIYVMNGWNGTAMTAVDIYDIATNTWSAGVPAPTGRSHAKTAIVGNQIYLLGGYTSGWTGLNEMFDTGTNTWTTLAPMPTARYIHAVGAVSSTVYVAGGYTGSASNSFQSYNSTNNTWTFEANMPTARYRTDGAAVNGCFYVLGGYNGSNLAVNEGFCGVILPNAIELKGKKSGTKVALEWTDAAVEQADYFVVERGGADEEFRTLETVDAETEVNGRFEFDDEDPLDGQNLYRLRRVDLNGKTSYTAAVEINFGNGDGFGLGWSAATSSLVVTWGAELEAGLVKVALFDLAGREVQRFDPIAIGFEATAFAERKAVFPVSDIADGVYLVRVLSGGEVFSRRVLLSR
jgi:N-acetylneuraminic acid mutarotase